MSIQKIFMTLVIVIACLVIGALVLNVLLPNATTQLVNAFENAIFSGTGMKFDLNGDGKSGEDGGADAAGKVDNVNSDEDSIGDGIVGGYNGNSGAGGGFKSGN